ncbi:MAG: sulfatase [Deltaproteobacteria bacterium]|nr:sulfatase [Deltaproteobacteria bacterium]
MARKAIVTILLAATFAVAAVLFWTASGGKAGPPNVLVILIDTLRADHMSLYGYERKTTPNLDLFGEENLVFERAMSAAAWTPPSVASIFTGMYASVHGHMPLRSETSYGKRNTKLDDSFHTLGELFKGAGYATALISANPLINRRFGFAQGFDTFISPGRERGAKVNRRAMKYLSDLWPREKPFFLYLQYMDPHDPYEAPAPYDAEFSGPLAAREYDEKELALIGAYDGEIKYVDAKIGELFDWLKSEGLYEDTIIVIFSDHGEQFMERGYQGHADRVYSEEIHVPLIIKAPGLKGRIAEVVSLIDVYPTLSELSGAQFTHTVHGLSLISQLQARKGKGVLAEIIRHHNEKGYLRPNGEKLITLYPMERGLTGHSPGPISEQYFDLNKDPFELAPLPDAAVLEKLRSEYEAEYSEILRSKEGYTVGETELDDKTLKQLKTLGYL